MGSKSMPSQANQLHFILFPHMAQGHMIPMVDIAKLLARRGALITIFTTPLNASRFKTVLSRATESGLRIRLILLKFPCEEVGLPLDCENCDLVPSPNYFINFITAIYMLHKPVEDIVKELTPPPNCMIADMCLPWTIEVARMLGIPRISFHGLGCFCLLCLHSIRTSKIYDKMDSDSDYFVLPDLPDQIEMTKPQLPGSLLSTSSDFTRKLVAADLESYGVIANTFEELEPEYAKEYKKAKNGHMIPMVDIAKLLALRGALVTIFTTPLNASRFKTVLSRATESGLCIRLILLEFPCEEVGLPQGCENCDLLPSSNYLINFFTGLDMLQKPVEDIVKELTPPPNCMIADMCFPWTIEVARMLGIPRISFHGLGCFCLLCLHSVRTSKILDKIESDAEYFVVPDLPDRIEVTKPQLPDALVSTSNDFTRRLVAADLESYGVIANTFEELEPEYAEEYKKARNGKVWYMPFIHTHPFDPWDGTQRENDELV
ncbi:hypothetical protein FEM48_Zijuj12G0048500 [Ziziphus jujuba var. spinosa]|uniref:Uncharacterized protein n=1 Tax=Ziziphus jujuba var. spinosa TaxID=714518 RepID=A0A978UB99_ZIZJJ|nr:hypothetical protein FEM48_Zijuj12G0048500 [Ziziphus jujuba var. spinosa]